MTLRSFRLVLVAVAAVTATLVMLAVAPTGYATFAGQDGQLLWSLNRSAISLWVTGPQGQGAHKLPIAPPCGVLAGPLFAPSGEQIIFQRFVDCGNFEVVEIESED